MPVPRIAIVGRPNVGKSSLVNMLAGDKISIVEPTPGVTRDRVSVLVELPSPEGPDKTVELVDTGGFGVYTAADARYDEVGNDLAALRPEIEAQIAAAIADADVILFCIDCQAGITAADQEIVSLLRRGKLGAGSAKGQRTDGEPGSTRRPPRIVIVGTKCDGPSWEAHALELAGLGFGEPLMCSARTNYLRRDFTDRLWHETPEVPPGQVPPPADLRLAIIGKRNAGKSSLVNALAGAPRVIVSEIPGTTRDAVDVRFEMDGRSIIAIDTAGLRRKKSFQGPIEWYAFDRAKRAIERSDVVLLVVDAIEPLSQVDEQLAMLVQKSFKPVVIVVNKWDLVQDRPGPKGRPVSTRDFEDYLRKELKGLTFAPIAFVSADQGTNLRPTIDLAFELMDQATERVPTGPLNRLVEGIVSTRGPSDKVGSEAKVYYVAQVGVRPPTIAIVVNKPDLFTANYQRFLLNRFREELPFAEVPIRLFVRGRKPGKRGESREVDAHLPVGASTGGWTEAELAEIPDDADAYFDED